MCVLIRITVYSKKKNFRMNLAGPKLIESLVRGIFFFHTNWWKTEMKAMNKNLKVKDFSVMKRELRELAKQKEKKETDK